MLYLSGHSSELASQRLLDSTRPLSSFPFFPPLPLPSSPYIKLMLCNTFSLIKSTIMGIKGAKGPWHFLHLLHNLIFFQVFTIFLYSSFIKFKVMLNKRFNVTPWSLLGTKTEQYKYELCVYYIFFMIN